MKRAAMIMLEGFSKTYLSKEYTPFLYELVNQGTIATLEPMFAFRGIEATLFTGLYPNQHNIWTEFRFKESALQNYRKGMTKQNNAISLALKLSDIFANDRLRRAFRFGLQRVIKRENIQMAHLIPAEIINLFEPSLKVPIYGEKVLGAIPTLFDKLREEDQTFAYVEPTMIKGRDILERLEQAIKKRPNDLFWFIKLGEHDVIGHKFGPQSKEMKNCLIRLDKIVMKIVEILRKRYKTISFFILSAHGMSTVKGSINLKKQLKKLNVKLNTDYVVFLDSTMARFWFLNEKAHNEVNNLLKNINYGHVISEAERKDLKFPKDERCGELIFAIDEGYVIHPSYFHVSQIPKGMHGHAYTLSPDSYSPLIIYNSDLPNPGEKVTYADVFALLSCSLLK